MCTVCIYIYMYIYILLKQVKSNKHVGKTTLMVLSIERAILVCPRFSIKLKWWNNNDKHNTMEYNVGFPQL